ncbi:MAG TPA: hypothetical protein PLJ38_06130, partial [bacterium]|nr:hypothetical protein [bacterium]
MQINPALLIIDLQNDFIKNENSPVFIPSGKNIVQSIINIRELFALKKLFIFNIITVHSTNKNEWGKK